jgi:hypothetical protein
MGQNFGVAKWINADVDFNTADIDLAFRTGRAAIVANDYVIVMQIDIIKAKIALVPAVSRILSSREIEINHR